MLTRTVAIALLVGGAPALAAPQPPHDFGSGITCLDCHVPYGALSTPAESQGTASAGSGTLTLVDTSKAWDAGQWVGGVVTVTSGTNLGEFRTITASTTTSVSWATPLAASLAVGDAYQLGKTTHQDIETKCKSCHNPLGRAPTLINVGLHTPGGVVIGCGKCHDPHNVEPNSGVGQRLIRRQLRWARATAPAIYPSTNPSNVLIRSTNPWDGVCEACHTAAAYHRNNATGTHVHNATTSCSTCHSHQSGFRATQCEECHDVPQGSRRAVVGPGTEFSAVSHHARAAVGKKQCQVCHYTSNHQQGTVELRDPDLGEGLIHAYNPADPASLQGFCRACHDSDGSRAYGSTNPFGDGFGPPNIDWTMQKHADGVAEPLVAPDGGTVGYPLVPPLVSAQRGTYSLFCTDCHVSHGSPNAKLVRTVVNGVTLDGGIPEGAARQWRSLCDTCHTGSRHHNADVYAKLGGNPGCTFCHTHAGYKSCVDCHNHSSFF